MRKENHHKMIEQQSTKPNPEKASPLKSIKNKLGAVAAAAVELVKNTRGILTGHDSAYVDRPGLSGLPNAGGEKPSSREGTGFGEEELHALAKVGVEVIPNPGKKPDIVTEPPKPTLDDIARNKRKDEMRDAAAKRSTIDRTNPEGLTPYEQAMRDKYLGNEYDEGEYGNDERSEVEPENKANTEKTEMSVDEYEAATALKLARERFAKAGIAVETHFFKKYFGGKKRQAELEAATEQLKQSELEYMRIKFADEIEAAKQDADKQAELAAEIAQAAFANMQETSKRKSERYDEMLDGRNKFQKVAAKAGEWFTKGGKVSQWLKLGGAGFAVGTVASVVGGWPITTATLVATKLAVAGAVKQNILEERRGENRMADDRPDYLDSSFAKDMAGKEADYVMNRAVDMSVDELKDVSMRRQEDLRQRIGSGLAKYAVGFGLGGLAGNWLSSTYATGDSVPQSGSEAVDANSTGDSVPQSGSGAVDAGASTPEAPNVPEINFDSYDHPWDWAAEKFGDANAMDQLHNLADKAMADGHAVEWFNNDGSVWMKVDGSSATSDVLNVLGKYV